MPRIYGKSVMLRDFRREDISGMRAWCNDPDITRYLGPRYTAPIPWSRPRRSWTGISGATPAATTW